MNDRQLAILDRLNREGSVEVRDLAEALGVSAVTIRKDLARLEEKGLLRRQHGVALGPSPNDVGYRMTFDYEVKKRIARCAAAMVETGETVMIESGSTCAMLAMELSECRRDVCIVTNSVFIASQVRKCPGARIVLLGGGFDPDAQVTSGPLVTVCARAFYVDKFFLGVDGYEEKQGFTNIDMQRAEAVRAMARSARKSIVLTDGSKFNRRSVVSLLPAKDVYMVITNKVPDNCRQSLGAAGVKIVLA